MKNLLIVSLLSSFLVACGGGSAEDAPVKETTPCTATLPYGSPGWWMKRITGEYSWGNSYAGYGPFATEAQAKACKVYQKALHPYWADSSFIVMYTEMSSPMVSPTATPAVTPTASN